jgi:hypothetical protein
MAEPDIQAELSGTWQRNVTGTVTLLGKEKIRAL